MQKKCMACKELIDAEALKCPRCKQIQSAIANFHNKPLFSVIMVLMLLALISWLAYVVVTSPGSEAYADYIQGEEFEISLSEVDGTTRVSCFANLVNASEWRWSGPRLIGEFYAEDGQRIDLHTERYEDVSIRPKSAARLRVSGNANANKSEYASCVIKVLDAY